VSDAGLRRGATQARLVDPLPVRSPWQYSGVLDLLSNGFAIAPVRATLARPTPRLPSNENRSASLGHRQPHVLASVLPAGLASMGNHTGWK
jgi:hypothetical protein